MKKTLTIPFLLACALSFSQNLVPNAGFELVNRMPGNKGNSISRSQDWIPPKFGSDYYYKNAGWRAGVPNNQFGTQKAHSGNAYAGICTRTNFLEYIETKLTDTLTKDQEYLVEFYISMAEISFGAVKEFGVLFTNKTIWGLTTRGISDKPQVDFINPKGYKSKTKWTKFSAVYKAGGNESVLILGHFNYDPADNKRRLFSHYYIDDVSVTPVKSKDDSVVGMQAEATALKAFSPKLGETITLQNIFFTTNKSELLPESFLELDKLVQYLNDAPNTSIKISGHTDNTGDEGQNKMLSEARAKAVADYLILNKIDQLRIMYTGYGSSKPIASNNTGEGKQLNRRVEFVISKK